MRARAVLAVLALLVTLLASTATAAPTSTRVRFTASGDFGMTTATGQALEAVAASGSDLHLALGDLSYGAPGTEASWCDFVTARVGAAFPFELLTGNHESDGRNGLIDNFAACLPNRLPGLVGTYGKQYYVDVPQVDPLVRFVMISPNIIFPDGTWNYPAGSARYTWTAAAIDGARAAGVPWVVVGMHKPCLSVGTYGCDVGADLANLLLSKKVDLVLSGHEHLYARSKQLALGAGCARLTIGSYNPACVRDADGQLVAGAGTVFMIIGNGGRPLRDVNQADPERAYFAAVSGANADPTHGSGLFEATPERLQMSFLRGSGGTFTDGFTLARSAEPPTSPVVASDAFERTVSGGWGAAPVGGGWTVSTAPGVSSVSQGTGRTVLRTAGEGPNALLSGVSARDVEVEVEYAVDKLPAGSSARVDRTLFLRRTSAGHYRAVVRMLANGQVRADLVRIVNGTSTALGSSVLVPNLTYAAGDALMVRAQVAGAGPAALRLKVWRKGTAEPSTWTLERSDSTPALQVMGSVGFQAFLSPGATNAPIEARYDNLLAVRLP